MPSRAPVHRCHHRKEHTPCTHALTRHDASLPPDCPPQRSACCSACWLAVSQAQVPTAIRPDGTLGTAVTQSGNVYDITGGTRPGNGPNLFHSFDRFSVGTGDTARFSGPTRDREHPEPGHWGAAVPHRRAAAIDDSRGESVSAQSERGAVWPQCQPGRQGVVSRQHSGLSALCGRGEIFCPPGPGERADGGAASGLRVFRE